MLAPSISGVQTSELWPWPLPLSFFRSHCPASAAWSHWNFHQKWPIIWARHAPLRLLFDLALTVFAWPCARIGHVPQPRAAFSAGAPMGWRILWAIVGTQLKQCVWLVEIEEHDTNNMEIKKHTRNHDRSQSVFHCWSRSWSRLSRSHFYYEAWLREVELLSCAENGWSSRGTNFPKLLGHSHDWRKSCSLEEFVIS